MDLKVFAKKLEYICDYYESRGFNVTLKYLTNKLDNNSRLSTSNFTYLYCKRNGEATKTWDRLSINPTQCYTIEIDRKIMPNNTQSFRDYVEYERLRRNNPDWSPANIDKWSVSGITCINVYDNPDNDEDQITWESSSIMTDNNSTTITFSQPKTTGIDDVYYFMQKQLDERVKFNLRKKLDSVQKNNYAKQIETYINRRKNRRDAEKFERYEKIESLLKKDFNKYFDICRNISDYWVDDVIMQKAVDEINAVVEDLSSDGYNTDDWDDDYTAHYDDLCWSFTKFLDDTYSGLIYLFLEDNELEPKLEDIQEWYKDCGDHTIPDDDYFSMDD